MMMMMIMATVRSMMLIMATVWEWSWWWWWRSWWWRSWIHCGQSGGRGITCVAAPPPIPHVMAYTSGCRIKQQWQHAYSDDDDADAYNGNMPTIDNSCLQWQHAYSGNMETAYSDDDGHDDDHDHESTAANRGDIYGFRARTCTGSGGQSSMFFRRSSKTVFEDRGRSSKTASGSGLVEKSTVFDGLRLGLRRFSTFLFGLRRFWGFRVWSSTFFDVFWLPLKPKV